MPDEEPRDPPEPPGGPDTGGRAAEPGIRSEILIRIDELENVKAQIDKRIKKMRKQLG